MDPHKEHELQEKIRMLESEIVATTATLMYRIQQLEQKLDEVLDIIEELPTRREVQRISRIEATSIRIL